jgi:hypothetical protein
VRFFISFLTQILLINVSTELPTADLLASSVYDEAKDLPPPPEIEVPAVPTPSGSTLRSSAGSSTSGPTKVPKWLKLGSEWLQFSWQSGERSDTRFVSVDREVITSHLWQHVT